MELVTALPTELAALVDPAACGAAPLLRSDAPRAETPGAGTPFASLLELLTAAVPPGQGLPAGGKGLPPDAPTALPESSPDPAFATAALPLPVLAALAPPPGADAGAAATSAAATSTAPAALPWGTPTPGAPAALQPTVATTAAPVDAERALPSPAPFELDLATDPAAAEPAAADGLPEPRASAALRDALLAATSGRAQPPAPTAAPAVPAASVPQSEAAAAAAMRNADVVPRALRASERTSTVPVAALGAATELASAPVHGLPAAAPHQGPAALFAGPHVAAAPLPHAQASIDLGTPAWHEAFASRIQWLVDTQVGEARIKLNPPDLGAVDVKISLVDDQTFVQLTAATASAREELAHGLPRLRELLTASGLELGGATVQSGADGRRDSGGHAAHAAQAERRGLERAFGDTPATPAPRRAAGRIDVFA